MASLSDLAVRYIERVVNRRDLTAVDEMVADGYRGSGPGWPATIGQLRQFYEEQMRDRPDWHIDVEHVLELGDSVVVRAHAQGSVTEGSARGQMAVNWLAHYRFRDRRITEIHVLTVVDVPIQP